jgi:hypothetical protein
MEALILVAESGGGCHHLVYCANVTHTAVGRRPALHPHEAILHPRRSPLETIRA